jgi:hypothetical protein
MDARVPSKQRRRGWPRGKPRGQPSEATRAKLSARRTSSTRPRDLVPIGEESGAGRFFTRMVREIEGDLGAGSRRNLSRITVELVRAFAGAATQMAYLNRQILLGEGSELDLAGFSNLASVMLRIGAKLGTERATKQILDMDSFLEMRRRTANVTTGPSMTPLEPEDVE